MNTKYSNWKMWYYVLCMVLTLQLAACSEETHDEYTAAPEIEDTYIDQLDALIAEMTDLQQNSDYGDKKGQYPTESRAILTGKNASGKSTFMKAVAINVILAQTINTCVAKNMKMPAIQVMTSMALRDDVLQGESYYMREIKYLKRMLDELKTGEPMLFVIDEILKGTNTRERLAASNAILSYMEQKQGFLLIATHDLELVYALKNRYDTYYFDSQVHEKDIVFPYKIRRGIVGKTNAIDLMELLDFPEEITDQARREVGKR